jgi:hypothetical protein
MASVHEIADANQHVAVTALVDGGQIKKCKNIHKRRVKLKIDGVGADVVELHFVVMLLFMKISTRLERSNRTEKSLAYYCKP